MNWPDLRNEAENSCMSILHSVYVWRSTPTLYNQCWNSYIAARLASGARRRDHIMLKDRCEVCLEVCSCIIYRPTRSVSRVNRPPLVIPQNRFFGSTFSINQ